MADWAPEGFARKNSGTRPRNLQEAISRLSPKAKQAFHAAATQQEIARGTWNGCAFNAGGQQLGIHVDSLNSAARAFDMPTEDVDSFIRMWDTSIFKSDKEATRHLKILLEESGLFEGATKPGGQFVGRTFVKVVHESEETKFNKMVESLDMDDVFLDAETLELKQAACKASELLGV